MVRIRYVSDRISDVTFNYLYIGKIANIPSKQSSISEIANLFRCLKYIIKSIKNFSNFLKFISNESRIRIQFFLRGNPGSDEKDSDPHYCLVGSANGRGE